MSDVIELYSLLTANTLGFQKGMAEAEASSAKLRSQNDLSMASAGKFALGVGVAGVGVAAVLVKMAGDFQSLTTTIVTGAGESVANLGLIRQGLLDMAGVVGSSPDALAKGLYQIESAGYHGQQALDILRISAEGAKVGLADQAVVADAVTTALNAYHMGAAGAASVTNTLIATVALGKTHMQDLAGSLGSILPVASALHISFPQISAAMATMTVQGTDATRAATSLRFLLASLAGPTTAAAKEMAGLGIGMKDIPGITEATQKSLADLGLHTSDVAATLADPSKGLPAALLMITDAIGKKFPNWRTAGGGVRGGPPWCCRWTRGLTAALELTGGNMATFQTDISTITGKATDARRSVAGWSLVQQDFNQRMQEASGAAQSLAITWGTALLPAATSLMTFLGDTAQLLTGTGSATAQADAPAQAFAGTLKDIGGFLHNDVLPPLETLGGWMVDHRQVVEAIGAGLATWWAIDKIAGWTSAASGAISKVFGSQILGGAGSKLAPQDVFVTNWGMMGGGWDCRRR